jgi:hypothetical protein
MVSLHNNIINFYYGKQLITTVKTEGVITSMIFGKYMELYALIMTTSEGGLEVKSLRNANILDSSISSFITPSEKQKQMIKVPPKTKLFVEKLEQEKKQTRSIHKIFQRDWHILKLKTSKMYLESLQRSLGSSIAMSDNHVKLSATIYGIYGPFKISIQVENFGQTFISNLIILLIYDPINIETETPLINVIFLLLILVTGTCSRA